MQPERTSHGRSRSVFNLPSTPLTSLPSHQTGLPSFQLQSGQSGFNAAVSHDSQAMGQPRLLRTRSLVVQSGSSEQDNPRVGSRPPLKRHNSEMAPYSPGSSPTSQRLAPDTSIKKPKRASEETIASLRDSPDPRIHVGSYGDRFKIQHFHASHQRLVRARGEAAALAKEAGITKADFASFNKLLQVLGRYYQPPTLGIAVMRKMNYQNPVGEAQTAIRDMLQRDFPSGPDALAFLNKLQNLFAIRGIAAHAMYYLGNTARRQILAEQGNSESYQVLEFFKTSGHEYYRNLGGAIDDLFDQALRDLEPRGLLPEKIAGYQIRRHFVSEDFPSALNSACHVVRPRLGTDSQWHLQGPDAAIRAYLQGSVNAGQAGRIAVDLTPMLDAGLKPEQAVEQMEALVTAYARDIGTQIEARKAQATLVQTLTGRGAFRADLRHKVGETQLQQFARDFVAAFASQGFNPSQPGLALKAALQKNPGLVQHTQALQAALDKKLKQKKCQACFAPAIQKQVAKRVNNLIAGKIRLVASGKVAGQAIFYTFSDNRAKPAKAGKAEAEPGQKKARRKKKAGEFSFWGGKEDLINKVVNRGYRADIIQFRHNLFNLVAGERGLDGFFDFLGNFDIFDTSLDRESQVATSGSPVDLNEKLHGVLDGLLKIGGSRDVETLSAASPSLSSSLDDEPQQFDLDLELDTGMHNQEADLSAPPTATVMQPAGSLMQDLLTLDTQDQRSTRTMSVGSAADLSDISDKDVPIWQSVLAELDRPSHGVLYGEVLCRLLVELDVQLKSATLPAANSATARLAGEAFDRMAELAGKLETLERDGPYDAYVQTVNFFLEEVIHVASLLDLYGDQPVSAYIRENIDDLFFLEPRAEEALETVDLILGQQQDAPKISDLKPEVFMFNGGHHAIAEGLINFQNAYLSGAATGQARQPVVRFQSNVYFELPHFMENENLGMDASPIADASQLSPSEVAATDALFMDIVANDPRAPSVKKADVRGAIAAFCKGRSAERPFTLFLDTTMNWSFDSDVRDLLQDKNVRQLIQAGVLNVVLMNSLVKYGNFGWDKYTSGMTMVFSNNQALKKPMVQGLAADEHRAGISPEFNRFFHMVFRGLHQSEIFRHDEPGSSDPLDVLEFESDPMNRLMTSLRMGYPDTQSQIFSHIDVIRGNAAYLQAALAARGVKSGESFIRVAERDESVTNLSLQFPALWSMFHEREKPFDTGALAAIGDFPAGREREVEALLTAVGWLTGSGKSLAVAGEDLADVSLLQVSARLKKAKVSRDVQEWFLDNHDAIKSALETYTAGQVLDKGRTTKFQANLTVLLEYYLYGLVQNRLGGELPATIRSSFGFPQSNLADCLDAVRWAPGTEPFEVQDVYAEVIATASRELETFFQGGDLGEKLQRLADLVGTGDYTAKFMQTPYGRKYMLDTFSRGDGEGFGAFLDVVTDTKDSDLNPEAVLAALGQRGASGVSREQLVAFREQIGPHATEMSLLQSMPILSSASSQTSARLLVHQFYSGMCQADLEACTEALQQFRQLVVEELASMPDIFAARDDFMADGKHASDWSRAMAAIKKKGTLEGGIALAKQLHALFDAEVESIVASYDPKKPDKRLDKLTTRDANYVKGLIRARRDRAQAAQSASMTSSLSAALLASLFGGSKPRKTPPPAPHIQGAQLVGIPNVGNTCYLASALNVLSSVAPYRALFYRAQDADYPSVLARDLAARARPILDALQGGQPVSADHVRALRDFLDDNHLLPPPDPVMAQRGQSARAAQHDPNEVMARKIIDAMKGALDRDIEFRQRETLTRQNDFVDTGVVRAPGQHDEYWDNDPATKNVDETVLELSINGKNSLTDALTSHFSDETLDDVYRLRATQQLGSYSVWQGSVTKATRMSEAPDVLTVALKRTELLDKDDREIDIPETLDIPGQVWGGQGQPPQYRLRCFIYHDGEDLTSGHYTTATRTGNGDNWRYHNDRSVGDLAHDGQFTRLKDMAYIYVYERVQQQQPQPLVQVAMPQALPLQQNHSLGSGTGFGMNTGMSSLRTSPPTAPFTPTQTSGSLRTGFSSVTQTRSAFSSLRTTTTPGQHSGFDRDDDDL